MHGGASTGPRTPEGRKRVGDATRARWVAGALADGWSVADPHIERAVRALLASNRNSRNRTAQDLDLTPHALRRVLAGLPSRPEEIEALRRYRFQR